MGPPQFGDTTQTKVFIGGLAWETQKDVLRHHFEKYGEILEAVIISDKFTGRSKGYGFVTFKEAEAAKKACEDPTPLINGRRANCNLASLGARRQGDKISPPTTPALPPPSMQLNKVAFGGSGGLSTRGGTAFNAAWYYAGAPTQAVAPHFYHQYAGGVPFYAASGAYGYSPAYVGATDLGYSAKPSNGSPGGTYLSSQFSYHGGMTSPNTMMHVHPMYQLHHHHQQYQPLNMGFSAAHFFPPTTTGAITVTPTIITKPKIIPSTPVE